MATFGQVEAQNAYEVVASSLSYSTLREYQIRVMSSFMRGNDVFRSAIYLQSFCYAVLPMADMLYHVLSFLSINYMVVPSFKTKLYS